MPNRNTTRGLLEQYFTTQWAGATPIAYANVPFDDSAVNEYVYVTIKFLKGENVCLGSAVTKRIRHTGMMYIDIYTKQNSSSFRAFELSDIVSDSMNNKAIASNLITYSSNAETIGAGSDGWYSIIVGIPFTSDEQ